MLKFSYEERLEYKNIVLHKIKRKKTIIPVKDFNTSQLTKRYRNL